MAEKTPALTVVYNLPNFLAGLVSSRNYSRWLSRKASAHCRRDRKRLPHVISMHEFKRAIHQAVTDCRGLDWYTGEQLDWHMISTYNNAASKSGGSICKAKFGLLPTVDHVLTDAGRYEFVICAWRTNDSKSDLSLAEFTNLCRRVLALHGNRTANVDK